MYLYQIHGVVTINDQPILSLRPHCDVYMLLTKPDMSPLSAAAFHSSTQVFKYSLSVAVKSCVFQILRVLSETAVAVRTKAMKCLAAVVEADPGILARVSSSINVRDSMV